MHSCGRQAPLVSGVIIAMLLASSAQSDDQTRGESPAAAGYESVAAELRSLLNKELPARNIPAFSIALVDGERIVWAEGLGTADSRTGAPATAETIYRVGSLSKLFTDLAVMQLVEQGRLKLDDPVSRVLPQFAPRNPSGDAITLRRLMSHRSGLVRESPVGSYFDPDEPGMAATLASLNQTAVVYQPGTRTKYSNAGISVVGSVLEAATGKPFEQQIQQSLLLPLGMTSSTYLRASADAERLCEGWMWSHDGQRFTAPVFDLGTLPAGNLYSSVTDLSRFLIAMFRGGTGDSGQSIAQPATLAKMLQRQEVKDGDYGLGFGLSKLDGARSFGHGGAVYGFSTQIKGLPDERLGVVAVASLDGSNGFVSRVVDHALRMLRAQQQGQPLPVWPETKGVPVSEARGLAGIYQHEGKTIELQARDGGLFLREGFRMSEVRQLGESLIVDDVFSYGPKFARPANGALVFQDKTYSRIEERVPPAPPPEHWRGLIGEYGWDHNTLYIYEDRGQLWALIEWFYYYPLTELSQDEYAFPDSGLYHGEKLIFQRDEQGRGIRVTAAEVGFERRASTDAAATFRITPQRLIDELRPIAMSAKPPEEVGEFRETDLVEVTTLDPTIRLDLRYAGENNFLGSRMYREGRAFLQRPAAEALVRAHREAQKYGLGVLIYDAYRPWSVTKMFWDATPADLRRFVADPSRGSRHNRGAAVDLTLCDLSTGEPVVMVSGYDEFTTRAYPDYPGGSSQSRWYRSLLRRLMEQQGFSVYEYEWWHFDFGDWREYRILNQPLEEMESGETESGELKD